MIKFNQVTITEGADFNSGKKTITITTEEIVNGVREAFSTTFFNDDGADFSKLVMAVTNLNEYIKHIKAIPVEEEWL